MSDALKTCDIDIQNYALVWEQVLRDEGDNVVALEKEVAMLNARMPRGEPRQPPELQGYSSKTGEYLEYLKMEFEEHDSIVFEGAEAIATKLQFVFHSGPNKKDKRCFEKASLAYEDDLSRLKDLRRASIICPTVGDIVMLCRELGPGMQLLRVKNRFDRLYQAAEQSAGYRDLQFNVRIPGNELVWELQVHLAAIEALKSKMRDTEDKNGRTGHQRYVAFRQIKERLEKGKRSQ